ncbi:MAG: InlB B-repeat-containing protein, partial [Candidatus Methanomethylophilaceae archaeon]|nr:InlB B-repeat-containing protein [Candidatus Methanomethylophilaceae archaeon]
MASTRLMLAVLALVAIVGIAAVIVIGMDGNRSQEERSQDETSVDGDSRTIVYHLEGGEFVGEVGTSYVPGTYQNLPTPVKEGKFFEGWYVDESHEEPLGAILSTLDEDLELYASWTDDIVGTYFTMSITGNNMMLTNRYSGTETWAYVAKVDGAYYVSNSYEIRSGWFFNPRVISDTGGYWTDEFEGDFHYIGNETIRLGFTTKYRCEVWEDSSGERQWIYRSLIPIKIVAPLSDVTLTYTLSRWGVMDYDQNFTLDVVEDYDLDVEGELDTTIGGTLTLTANGDRFYGWFEDGELVSTERTYVVQRATPDRLYEARSTADYVTLDTMSIDTDAYGLTGRVFLTAENGETEVLTPTTATKYGYFVITDSSSPVRKQIRVFIDVLKPFTVTWEYGGETYTYTDQLRYSDVYAYLLSDSASYRTANGGDYGRFFTFDDTYVKNIVTY